MADVPPGSRLWRIEWLSTPDKYSPPKLFDTVAKARAYDSTSYITAELELTTPDGNAVTLSGAVPSTDYMSNSEMARAKAAGEAQPAPNATLTSTEGTRHHFTNPDGGHWVLIT